MRAARAAFGVVTILLLASATVSAQPGGAGSTDVEIRWSLSPYPHMVYPSFLLGHMLWDGCSPLYLPGGPDGTCPVFRDEPVGFDASLTYDGPAIVELYRRGSRWVETWIVRADGARQPVTAETTVVDGSGAPVEGVILLAGAGSGPPHPPPVDPDPEATQPYVPPTVHARIHVDLAPVVANLPTGRHTICSELRGVTQPEVALTRHQPKCVTLTVHEPNSTRARAEHLRRRAIDQLAALRCDDAAATVEELLKVHPASAVGFRLRGTIAELQHRHHAAIFDYTRAIALVRRGDALLEREGMNVANALEGLASWRDSLQALLEYAPGESLLGRPGERPTCREERAGPR
jgi:hypothetical protein